MKEAKG